MKVKSTKTRESQNVEWKTSWRDEFLKWVCGFANAEGGVMVIGRNDKGEAVGVQNAKRLLEELPNKIRSTMGVVAEVGLKVENGKDMVEIHVPAYPNAISYHGKHYVRSGSTNQELSGYALDELLLRKYGRTYDSMPLPGIKFGDFWHDAFDIFRKKAVASKRLTARDVNVSGKNLLHSLKLIENDRLLLAAALVFHQSPERWCLGAYVKIGRFKEGAQILYQDEINGAVVGMADKVVETIFTKYFIGRIRYEGLQRIDDYPMPREALREAVTNALVHRDYSTGSPIQIRVYDDRVTIANDCRLPEGTTWEALSTAHKSVSHNPLVAGAMFRSGEIEAWGRGIEHLVESCVLDKLPQPEFFITPRTFTIIFHIRNMAENVEDAPGIDGIEGVKKGMKGVQDNAQESALITALKNAPENALKIFEAIRVNPGVTLSDMAKSLDVSRRTVATQIRDIKAKNWIHRIGSLKGGHWEVSDDVKHALENNGIIGADEGLETMRKASPKIALKTAPKTALKTSQKISLKIIGTIRANPAVSLPEIANYLGISRRTVATKINNLKAQGRIRRVGPDKGGHWEVLEKPD